MNTNNQDTLTLIVKYGIMVRQIPVETTSLWGYNEKVHGSRPLKENESLVEENGRKLIKEVKRPVNGGKWMAKQATNTSSKVHWSIREDNLSDTIDEAVLKVVAQILSEK
ncbi:hypothetical protein VCHA53O466_40462 [Vibrio chagasii]|nr:hypothetical protein VCHA53O466_40462 [Vibrio chagasii]